jgi:HAD superfamily hydrolase (TIGR01509 family)
MYYNYTMKKSIKFIYFDIGGVMLKWRRLFDHIAAKHQKKASEVEAAFAKYDNLSCLGLMSSEKLWRNVRKELKIRKKDAFDIIALSLETFEPIRETHEFAQEIINSLPIGLLTNNHPDSLALFFKNKLVPDLRYHAVIESHKLGLIKPDKEIYRRAQRQANVPHENILFIDDLPQNVESAALLGWQTILFESDRPKSSIAQIKGTVLQ